MKWPISDQITPNLNTVCTAPAARRHPLHTPGVHTYPLQYLQGL